MKFTQTCKVLKFSYQKIFINKNSISAPGKNICKGFKKTKCICSTIPQNVSFCHIILQENVLIRFQ